MSSDRLTVEQVAILKAADANGKLLHDTDMRRLFKHIEALEGEVADWKSAANEYLAWNEAWRARAERLRAALEGLVEQVADVDTWLRHSDAYEAARKALEDDKQ